MADPIRRVVGSDGRVTLTNAPAPRSKQSGLDPSIAALIEATRGVDHPHIPDGGVDQMLSDAHSYLADPTTFGYQLDVNRKASQPTAEEGRLREDARVAPVLAQAGRAALIPASFLGGPVGMAAGGAMTLDAIDELINNPSVTNAIPVALGALPFVKPIRNAMKARNEAKAVDEIRQTYGAGDMGAFRAERPVQPATRGPMPYKFSQQPSMAAVDEAVGNPSLEAAVRERISPDELTSIFNPNDWRQVPPTRGGKANFVKQHAHQSQQELAQQLGERDFGFGDKGIRIKRLLKPIYPEGNSKTDKLVAAMRQREKLMGYKD